MPSAPTLVPLKVEHGGTSSPTRDRHCHWPHTSSLPQGRRQVLGADLNYSETRWTPDLLLGFHRKDSTRDPGTGPLHCGILSGVYACACRESDSAILVMKAAEDRL